MVSNRLQCLTDFRRVILNGGRDRADSGKMASLGPDNSSTDKSQQTPKSSQDKPLVKKCSTIARLLSRILLFAAARPPQGGVQGAQPREKTSGFGCICVKKIVSGNGHI